MFDYLFGWAFGNHSPPHTSNPALGAGAGTELQLPEVPVILHDNGFTVSTWEYVNNGVEEGWLELIGWNVGECRVTWRYRLTDIPKNAM